MRPILKAAEKGGMLAQPADVVTFSLSLSVSLSTDCRPLTVNADVTDTA